MPRARMYFTVIFATALTIAAFEVRNRMAEPLPERKGTTRLPTKSQDRVVDQAQKPNSWEPIEPKRTPSEEQRVEIYLKEKGRSAANLWAALLVAKEDDVYRDELSERKDDPVALAWCAGEFGNLNSALIRAREPNNLYAEIVEFRGSDLTSDEELLAILAKTKGKQRYDSHLTERSHAYFEMRRYLGDDVRDAWQKAYGPMSEEVIALSCSPSTIDLPWCHRLAEAIRNEADPAKRLEAIQLAQALARGCGDEAGAGLNSVIAGIEPPQELLEAKDRTGFAAHKAVWAAAQAVELAINEQFRAAFHMATNEDLEVLANVHQQRGKNAAKQALIERIGQDKLKRRVKQTK